MPEKPRIEPPTLEALDRMASRVRPFVETIEDSQDRVGEILDLLAIPREGESSPRFPLTPGELAIREVMSDERFPEQWEMEGLNRFNESRKATMGVEQPLDQQEV